MTPILKANKPPEVTEPYTPIYLMSCMVEAMEKIINNRLNWQLDYLNVLPQARTGFRRDCTLTGNLIQIVTAIKSESNSRCSTTVIFLDISKAYDNAWIERLLFKLTKAKVKCHTLTFFLNIGISIRFNVNSHLSEERQI